MNDNNNDYDYEYEEISADRLCQAAEAILSAVAMLAEDGISKPAPEILGSPVQPACLSDFTREEVVEAAAFLHRLGILSDD